MVKKTLHIGVDSSDLEIYEILKRLSPAITQSIIFNTGLREMTKKIANENDWVPEKIIDEFVHENHEKIREIEEDTKSWALIRRERTGPEALQKHKQRRNALADGSRAVTREELGISDLEID